MAVASISATANAVYIIGSIFAATLPVTPAGIIQAPASGSTQNGFVEKFDPTGATRLYATYLSGQGGNTSPAAIAADPAGNAYIAGYTETSGYPTIAAVVPRHHSSNRRRNLRLPHQALFERQRHRLLHLHSRTGRQLRRL